MNLQSKDANNTVYLEEVAVSHTKQFFGNNRPETKKITTLTVIVPYLDGSKRWQAHGF